MLVPTESSDSKNTHVKYQSFSTHYTNVINKVKVGSNSKVKVTIVGTQVKHQSSRSHCSKAIRKLKVLF